MAHALGLTKVDTGTARQDAFAARMLAAERTPAPPGKTRAVVMVVTTRGRFEAGGGTDGGPSESDITFSSNSAAVLSVNVPGRPPYAVFVPKFKFARGRQDLSRGGLPALVSMQDRNDIEIQWDEVPSIESQVAERMAASMATAQQRTAEATALGDQISAAVAAGTSGADVKAGVAAMAPQMRQLAIDNLKRSLRYVSDPSMRQQMINQYRAVGIVLTDDDLRE